MHFSLILFMMDRIKSLLKSGKFCAQVEKFFRKLYDLLEIYRQFSQKINGPGFAIYF